MRKTLISCLGRVIRREPAGGGRSFVAGASPLFGIKKLEHFASFRAAASWQHPAAGDGQALRCRSACRQTHGTRGFSGEAGQRDAGGGGAAATGEGENRTEQTGEEATAADTAGSEDKEAQGSDEAALEKLKAELEDKDEQVRDLNDKLLRTLADMENLRERTRRQAEAAEKFAIQSFCKDVLDVADNLARAASTVEEDVMAEGSDSEKVKAVLTSLHEGVLLTEKQLLSVRPRYRSI